MNIIGNNPSNSSFKDPVDADSVNNTPNYGKAALYIVIASVAAVAFTALLACTGGGVVIAGFMLSIGLAVDAVAILAGVIFLAIFAGFMCYETIRLSLKADKILQHPFDGGSFSSEPSI